MLTEATTRSHCTSSGSQRQADLKHETHMQQLLNTDQYFHEQIKGAAWHLEDIFTQTVSLGQISRHQNVYNPLEGAIRQRWGEKGQ